jgi:hypothetical protein
MSAAAALVKVLIASLRECERMHVSRKTSAFASTRRAKAKLRAKHGRVKAPPDVSRLSGKMQQ